jgi:hypothetical protein
MTFDPVKAIESVASQRTKLEKEEWERFQQEEREKLKALDLNAFYGFNAVEIALKQLEHGESDFEYTRMAEGYALMGDFEKAIDLTRDPEKKAEYQTILDAHTNLDCPCPPTQRVGKDTLPTRFRKLEFGGKTLVECSLCGNLTVC